MLKMNERDFIAEVTKINMDSVITLVVNGEKNNFKIIQQADDSYELEVINSNCKAVYGMSCENIADIISVLLADYVRNITTYIHVNN